MAETALADYVTTARGKGASEWRILRHHVARNAAIPVVTVIATLAADILYLALDPRIRYAEHTA